MRRREPALTRRGLLGVSAALLGTPLVRAETAVPSRPDVILSGGGRRAVEGFRFANYRGHFPFWLPEWGDVLAGRPLGCCAMPAQGTLLDAFTSAGYATAFAASPVAGSRAKPHLIVVLHAVDPDVAGNAILISLPPLRASSADGLVIRMPGGTAASGSSDVPMNPLDIAPTVCGLASVPGSPAFVGRDYSALVPGVSMTVTEGQG